MKIRLLNTARGLIPCYDDDFDEKKKLKIGEEYVAEIAFDKMDEAEFSELYERVKDVLFEVFLKNISIEEFEANLMNF